MDYKGIIINNLKAVGTLTAKEQRTQFKNAQYSLNTPEDVVIKNCSFGLNGYNCLEIGLNASIQPPKSVTIEDCDFCGTLANNAILIFATQDNAVINIRNCHFTALSNLLRLSNRTNATGVVVNIENCQIDAYETIPEWRGLFLMENYTDKTLEDIEANNRFSPDKITINIDNVSTLVDGEYVVINPSDLASVTNSGNPDQLFIHCQDYMSGENYIPPFNPGAFPHVTINGNPLPGIIEPEVEASEEIEHEEGD